MDYFLALVSWLIRAFGAVQSQRNIIDRPLIWNNPIVRLILILIWFSLLIYSLYLGFQSGGIMEVVVILILYFIAFPIILGKYIKKIMDKLGI